MLIEVELLGGWDILIIMSVDIVMLIISPIRSPEKIDQAWQKSRNRMGIPIAKPIPRPTRSRLVVGSEFGIIRKRINPNINPTTIDEEK